MLKFFAKLGSKKELCFCILEAGVISHDFYI